MSRSFAVFYDLYLMQLANYRWTWKWQIIWGLIAPLSFMFTARTILARDATLDLGAHILAGNLILSSLFTTMGNTANRFAWLKEFEGLDYYATLPISRAELGTVVPRLLAELGERAIEDLRLQTHSLEDLYLAYGAGQAQTEARELALAEEGT